MTSLELPPYKVIFPNEIFGKEAEPLEQLVGGVLVGEAPATQITKIVRFKAPTQEEIINSIIASAKNIDILSLEKYKPTNNHFETASSLRLLPSSEIQNIQRGDVDMLNHLKVHYFEDDLQEGKYYLASYIGVIANQILDSANILSAKRGTGVYDEMMQAVGLRKWDLRVRLLESGAFPDRLELEYMLDRGVRDSDVFSVRGDYGDYCTIASHMRILYDNLHSPEIITQVADTSRQFLNFKAISTVREISQCIAVKNEHLKKQDSQQDRKIYGNYL